MYNTLIGGVIMNLGVEGKIKHACLSRLGNTMKINELKEKEDLVDVFLHIIFFIQFLIVLFIILSSTAEVKVIQSYFPLDYLAFLIFPLLLLFLFTLKALLVYRINKIKNKIKVADDFLKEEYLKWKMENN